MSKSRQIANENLYQLKPGKINYSISKASFYDDLSVSFHVDEINFSYDSPDGGAWLKREIKGGNVLIKEGNRLIKSIPVSLDHDENENVKLILRISQDAFVVLVYDHQNIINNYKSWKLHLGSISEGTCKPLFKIHRDEHFYPDHLALLPDNKTLVGWDNYSDDVAYRQVCFINLETLAVQTIQMPFQEHDKVSSIQVYNGQLIFMVNYEEQCFDVIDKSLENKKTALPFFDHTQSQKAAAVVKPELDKNNNELTKGPK